MELLSNEPIIPLEDHKKYREFKYQGYDYSIYYKYIVTPLCELFLNYIPEWVAPNVITLLGLFCNIISYSITFYYAGFNGRELIPNWVAHFASLMYMTYYYLDNLDGKQARKTGSSSALGTFMDHCCDSVTTYLITGVIGSLVGLESVWTYGLLWCMVCFPFFTTIWEENITRFFYLPPINGVSEGTLVTCGVISYIGFFQRPFDYSFTLFGSEIFMRDFQVGFFFSLGFTFFIITLCKVFYNYWDRRWELLSHFRVFSYIIITLFNISWFAHDSYVCREYPRLVVLSSGLCFNQLCARMLMKTVTKSEEFKQDCYSNNVYMFMINLAILLKSITGTELIDIILLFGFFLNLTSWVVFINRLTTEMADIAGIYRFKLGKKPIAGKTG